MTHRTFVFFVLVPALAGTPALTLADAPVRPAQGPRGVQAAIGVAPARRAAAHEAKLPGVPVARPVAVGFAADARLREAVRTRLIQLGRYRLDPSPRIPTDPFGLLVSGRLIQLQEDAGWMDCRVRYFVTSKPGLVTRLVDTVAASVPVLPSRRPEERGEAQETAAAACLSEVAQEIAQKLRRTAG